MKLIDWLVTRLGPNMNDIGDAPSRPCRESLFQSGNRDLTSLSEVKCVVVTYLESPPLRRYPVRGMASGVGSR